jgi:glyoxylase-like metal-dependent hydrolase (beta-lactamase superfamily II)
MLPRRHFLLGSLALAAFESLPAQLRADMPTAAALPVWKPGVLEIHHIATNRGNSALLILPDGTTMMVDAGAIYGTTPYLSDLLPSNQHRPGEWIGRYAKRRLEASGLTSIDTFLLTHLHGDHVGYLSPDTPLSPNGAYKLTGVSDVAAIVPIQRFVDRAYPDYAYPSPADADFQKNYRAFLQSQTKAGKTVERFHPGSKDQFTLRHKPATYPTFEIRNLIANGEVWTGEADHTKKLFPDLSTLKPADYPAENPCSCAIRLRYGRFGYYTGGDLTNDTNYGRDPWRDSESPTAEACGPVSVAVTNHHGYYNANGDRYVRALRPQVFIIPAWDSAHPTVNVLNTLYSKAIYPGNRDVFATLVQKDNRIANKKTDDLKSRAGHIVIRVDPGGDTFNVHILSNTDETDTVKATFGPYTA